jgi:hypothetical protein
MKNGGMYSFPSAMAMQCLHTYKEGFFLEKDAFHDSLFGNRQLLDWLPQIGGSPYWSVIPVMP